MSVDLGEVLSLISCPDDGGRLSHEGGELQCSVCERHFRAYEQNLIEFLPRAYQRLPASISAQYNEGYKEAFEKTFENHREGLAWGAAEIMPASWRRKRYRQVEFIRPLIAKGANSNGSVLCDIAAGAGYYTLAYAPLFRLVLHCDLSVENLNYARSKARQQGIRNIFFLRVDYFALPFRRTLDRVLCLDTLIRGEAHDSIVLTAVADSLRPTGCAVVDFHNWWHNPVRRLGLLPENFHNNRSYARRKTDALLRLLHTDEVTCRPFVQESDGDTLGGRFVRRVLPATRFIYRFASPNEQSPLRPMAIAQQRSR